MFVSLPDIVITPEDLPILDDVERILAQSSVNYQNSQSTLSNTQKETQPKQFPSNQSQENPDLTHARDHHNTSAQSQHFHPEAIKIRRPAKRTNRKIRK